ncbi:MAG: acetyl-CoA carboxylase carboxyl transferase subunit beta, partial [Pirellula sp.]|nr:acetyl-CoA carboxylase carboxyl transferase subunit beta [Pirellula sp.]
MSTVPSQSTPNSGSRVEKKGVPEGLWIRCPGCGETIYRKEMERNLNVCPKCNYHMYVSAWDRVGQLLDENTFEICDEHVLPTDPLSFSDKKTYAQRLTEE